MNSRPHRLQRQQVPIHRQLAMLLMAALLAVACSAQVDDIAASNDDESQTPTATTQATISGPTEIAPEAAEPTTAEPSSAPISELLGRLPASLIDGAAEQAGAEFQITVGDYALASEATELSTPDRSSFEATRDWFDVLTRGERDESAPSYIAARYLFPNPITFFSGIGPRDVRELGFSMLGVDNFASFQDPSVQLSVFGGSLDIGDELRSAAPILDVGAGADGAIDFAARTVLRSLGEPLRIATDGDVVAVSNWTPSIESWLDEAEPSVLADERIATVAAELDRTRSLSAEIYVADGTFEAADAGAISVPFVALGFGSSMAEGQPTTVIVYVFATEDEATEALPEIEEGWRTSQMSVSPDVALLDLFNSMTVEQSGLAVTVSGPVSNGTSTSVGARLHASDEPLLRYQPQG